jgi:SAM-dependent methyltransferase
MIDHSNLEDYEDPVIYDAENGVFEPDGPFYHALAQKVGGPVLELGCGTGRITIPLAKHGIVMTGLDIVPSMLGRAQQKSGSLPIHWVEADMRTFQLGRKFRLICATGGAFQHLLTRADQEMALASVHVHLAPEGYFAIDVAVPHPAWLHTVDEEQEWNAFSDEEGRQIRVTGTEAYDPIAQVKHETVYRQWQTEDGLTIRRRARFAIRYIFPQEMEALLHYNGFKIMDCYGGADFDRVTKESRTLFYVCQAG